MKKLFALILMISVAIMCHAQEKADNFMYNSIDGYIHLYYDNHYYLMDQNCEFKTYTRVIKYNKSEGGFNSFFTDYYNNNTIALSGNYIKGSKEGEFKGFYPNGAPRFLIYFKDDFPVGEWKYFYSDGSPWLDIVYKNSIPKIINYWNTKHKQKVKEGTGRYQFIDETKSYNEFGYSAVLYSGKLKDGLPNGLWLTSLKYANKIDELIGQELFADHKLVASQYIFPENATFKNSILKLYPDFEALEAEDFELKNCTIDDNQEYCLYLQNKLNSTLSGIWLLKEIPTENSFEIAVTIDAQGQSKKVTVPTNLPQQFGELLYNSLKNIPYWIPSFLNGKTIDDTLIIKLTKLTNANGEMSFGYPQITRKTGR